MHPCAFGIDRVSATEGGNHCTKDLSEVAGDPYHIWIPKFYYL